MTQPFLHLLLRISTAAALALSIVCMPVRSHGTSGSGGGGTIETGTSQETAADVVCLLPLSDGSRARTLKAVQSETEEVKEELGRFLRAVGFAFEGFSVRSRNRFPIPMKVSIPLSSAQPLRC